MTTAQHMLAATRRFTRALGACSILLLVLTGCESTPPEFNAPRALVAPPYSIDPGPELVWAVAPLLNESGVAAAPAERVSDALVGQIEQVDGLAAVPLNRSIAAMRSLGLSAISTPDEAIALGRTLGVDAVVAGSISSWDPYDPPRIGLALALFIMPGSPMASPSPAPVVDAGPPDPVLLQASPVERPMAGDQWDARPATVVSEELDASNHAVQMAVKEFAEGRSPTVSALGWRRYLASMPLYAEFACFRLTDRLLDAERRRIEGWSRTEPPR